jgi:hypothetical protein
MEKIDIRQHSDRERALLRKQVVRLRKQGKSNKEVAELLGLSVQTSSRWWQLELQEKSGRIKKLKTSIDNIYVSILLVKGIPRLNESASGYKRHGYTQRGFSATLPCYGYFFHRSSQTSGS